MAAPKRNTRTRTAATQPEPVIDETPDFSALLDLEEGATEPVDEADERDKKIAELQAQLAALSGNSVSQENSVPAPTVLDVPDGEVVLFHFVEDGFVAMGQSWYRGQEVEIVKGSTEWDDLFDRKGHSWIELLDDVEGQWKRFGKQMFARGPWMGRPWGWVDPNETDENVIKAAEAAKRAEQKRGRKVPRT